MWARWSWYSNVLLITILQPDVQDSDKVGTGGIEVVSCNVLGQVNEDLDFHDGRSRVGRSANGHDRYGGDLVTVLYGVICLRRIERH